MIRVFCCWSFLVAGFTPVAQAQETAQDEQKMEEPADARPQHWFDHIHITVEGGACPFLAVIYAVRMVDDQAFVLQTKQYPKVSVYDNRVAVVPAEEARKLFTRIAKLGALDLLDASVEAPLTLNYEIEFAWQQRANRFQVKGGDLLEDLRYAQIVDMVEKFVEKYTGVAHFRDVVVPETALGLLNLRTFPPVEVTVDGVPLGKTTPISGLEMKAGTHTAALYSPDLNVTRRIKFSIYKGEVTNLNLNIEK